MRLNCMNNLPATIDAVVRECATLWPKAFGHVSPQVPISERLTLLRRLKAIRTHLNLPTVWETRGGDGRVIARRALIDDEVARLEEVQRIMSQGACRMGV